MFVPNVLCYFVSVICPTLLLKLKLFCLVLMPKYLFVFKANVQCWSPSPFHTTSLRPRLTGYRSDTQRLPLYQFISPVHPLGHPHLYLSRGSKLQMPLLAQGLLG